MKKGMWNWDQVPPAVRQRVRRVSGSGLRDKRTLLSLSDVVRSYFQIRRHWDLFLMAVHGEPRDQYLDRRSILAAFARRLQ